MPKIALRFLFIIAVFFLTLISCKNAQSTFSAEPKTVAIQPLGDFSKKLSDTIFRQIKTLLPNVVLLPNVGLPKAAFYPPRNRYRADSIIRIFKPINKDTIRIVLTDKDISTTKNDIKDWGVMGLAYSPGNSCVVSTFRLSKKELYSQFYKVAVHELGHTQGLSHCPVKTCFMRDAEGGNPLNEEVSFCTDCTSFLNKKHWNLK